MKSSHKFIFIVIGCIIGVIMLAQMQDTRLAKEHKVAYDVTSKYVTDTTVVNIVEDNSTLLTEKQ
ncbi:MAG: hypothetical protein PF440_00425 [Thiomicrorhabdus sp.]|jgi:hypothetical protein|nr:hypothetical protein [Thiomicrorhabdus sp.]